MYHDLIETCEFEDIPLSLKHAPFVRSRVLDALATIKGAMQQNDNIIVCRIELRIPHSYMQGFLFDSSKLVTRMIDYYRNLARKTQERNLSRCEIIRKASVDVLSGRHA